LVPAAFTIVPGHVLGLGGARPPSEKLNIAGIGAGGQGAHDIGHYREWIEAAKGGKPAGSNFDWAGPLAEVVLLGNVALRVGLREKLTRTKLLWDPANLKIPNLPEANEYLRRPYRQGWTL
jgi:hypothetical protein